MNKGEWAAFIYDQGSFLPIPEDVLGYRTPKALKTGPYVFKLFLMTGETMIFSDHEVIRAWLEGRGKSKLKMTYFLDLIERAVKREGILGFFNENYLHALLKRNGVPECFMRTSFVYPTGETL